MLRLSALRRAVRLASRAAVRGTSLIAAALVAVPAVAAAQTSGYNGDVSINKPYQSPYYLTGPELRKSLEIVGDGGSRARVYTDRGTGKLGALFASAPGGVNASGSASLWTTLRVRRQATSFLLPVEFHLDGAFVNPGNTGDWRTPGADMFGWFRAGSSFSQWQLAMTGVPGTQAHAISRTIMVPIPGSTTPNLFSDVTVSMFLSGQAANGAVADFSHTLGIYVPKIQGQEWTALDGSLATQSRPSWATTRQPGEIVTTPEPGTVVLLGAGLVALLGGAGVRRRRAVA